jgi:outer membrane receptor protein involved in Fe transport
MKTIRDLALLGVVILLSGAAAAQQNPAPKVRLDIEPQPIMAALEKFADQTGLQIVFRDESVPVEGVRTPGVVGELTPDEALNQLLLNTQLKYEFVNAHTVRIMQAPSSGENLTKHSSAGSTLFAQAGSMGADSAAGEHEEELDEIVVTAQKRIERLIDVPQSVTVLSADSLAKLAAVQFRDYANTVPGLSFFTSGAGYTQVTLRGVTTGFDISPTVGIYVDEVPYGSSTPFTGAAYTALDVGLFDVDRIEVLRGPQGTLYGASSLGGLIKYVTKQPDATHFGTEVRTGISSTRDGGLNYDISGAVNAPLVAEKVALRVSGFESRDGGYVDNVAQGRDDVNQSDIYGGRFDLLVTPTDALSVRFTGFVQNISRDGNATVDYTFAGDPVSSSLEQSRVTREPFDHRFRLASATVSYDFGSMALTSASSYQTVRTHQFADQTSYYAPFFPGFYSAVSLDSNLSTDKFTQELRLSSAGGQPIDWVIGGFYTHESSDSRTFLHTRDIIGQPFPVADFGANPTRYDEYAGFGDLTWRPSEKIDVTGGVRYAHQKLSYRQNGNFNSIDSTDNVLTYLANTRYHLSNHATLYGRYATGYRPGGANPITTDPLAPRTFDADSLKSYELGFKGETEDRRFGVDVSAFYTDWSNPQIFGVRGFTGVLVNVEGGATIKGVELALTARPVTRFTATGMISYQDSELQEDNVDLGGVKGERLPNVARFTAAANVDYLFAEGGLRPTLGATVRHASDRNASFNNSVGTPQYFLPDYTLVDVRAGVTFDPVTVQFYVRNVFDKRAELSAYTIYGSPLVGIAQPRTIGISASTRF